MFFRNKQERFPEEFRIDSSDWDYKSILDLLNQEDKNESSVDVDMLKDIVFRIWRVNNRSESYKSNNNLKRVESLVKNNDDFDDAESKYIIKNLKDSLKPVKFAGKQTKSILKTFEENGFEIKDHTNSKYHDGMALKVLLFETDEKLEESVITETIKPSIYYNGELILNGEVVVSIPPKNEN